MGQELGWTPGQRRAVAVSAAVAAVACTWVGVSVLGATPHVPDEGAYLFQARLLAAGKLWAEGLPHEIPAPFSWVDPDGRWFGAFPDGWPLVLAVGVLGGRLVDGVAAGAGWYVPYLVNPALTALGVVAVARLASRVAGAAAVVPAAVVAAASPQILLLGGSLMSHALVLACAARTLELACVLAPGTRTGEEARRWWGPAVEAGLWIGLVGLARPLCGVLLAVGAFAWRPSLRWAAAAPFAAGVVALQLGHNVLLTGHALDFPIDRFTELTLPSRPRCNGLGFGPDRGCHDTPEGHTVAGAWSGTVGNLVSWAQLLPAPTIFLALASAGGRRLLVPAAGFGALVAAGYSLYWYPGTCFGARFYHLAVPGLVVAAAAGVAGLPERPRRWSLAAVVGLGLVSFSRALPELPDYWGVDGRVAALVRGWEAGPATILFDLRPERRRIEVPVTGPDAIGAKAPWQYLVLQEPDPELAFGAWSPEGLAWARSRGLPVYRYTVEDVDAEPRLERLVGPTPAQ